MSNGINLREARPYVYIAYKHKDKKRVGAVRKIADVLESFGYDAWFDDKRESGDDWPNKCSRAMLRANEFLLLAHKDTHNSRTVTEHEISAAIDRHCRKLCRHIVTLIMHPHVDLDQYNAFLNSKPRISILKSGWQRKLCEAFATHTELLTELLALVESGDRTKDGDAKLLLQEILNSASPTSLEEGLGLLLENCSERKTYTQIFEAMQSLKKRVAGTRPLHAMSRAPRPSRKQAAAQKKMLDDIRQEHPESVVTACKLYEALIYLFKGCSLAIPAMARRISSLPGLNARTVRIIVGKLLQYKIVVRIGSVLWFEDDKLGRRIMREVFFGTSPIADFDRIEELFSGEH